VSLIYYELNYKLSVIVYANNASFLSFSSNFNYKISAISSISSSHTSSSVYAFPFTIMAGATS
jgi:hypothetical protein